MLDCRESCDDTLWYTIVNRCQLLLDLHYMCLWTAVPGSFESEGCRGSFRILPQLTALLVISPDELNGTLKSTLQYGRGLVRLVVYRVGMQIGPT